MRLPRTFAFASILLLAACGDDARAPTDPLAPTAPASLLEGFEADRLWAVDSANNPAVLTPVEGPRSEGEWALAVDWRDEGRGKTIVRKEVADDLTTATHLLIDACVADGVPPKLALAVLGKGDAWTETPAVTLQPGWNRDIAFALDGLGDAAKWPAQRAQVGRLMVLVLPGEGKAGRVVLDNLRSAGSVTRAAEPPTPVEQALPARVGLRQSCELRLTVALRAPADAIRQPAGLDRAPPITAEVRAPDGTAFPVRGFLDRLEAKDGRLLATYAVRVMPWEPGPWWVQATVGTGAAALPLSPMVAVCDPALGRAMAPARVDAGDPRWFSDGEGTFLWPVGCNLAWAADYGPWFDRLAAQGVGLVRVWLCPWNHPLDTNGRFDGVDAAHAAEIDRMFAHAARTGMRVQLVLTHHGSLGGDWGRNPYNKANDGPCADPREFWTNATARAWYRRYLDECQARWGARPELFAWELINEADLMPAFRPGDVVEWHREMAGHLRRSDPWRHLVATSTAGADRLARLWELPELSFVQSHAYSPDLPAVLARLAGIADPGRPLQLGEIGRGWLPAQDLPDAEGRLLQVALWLGWMHGLAGSAMPWWWDTHIEARDLFPRFGPIARFAAGEDRRGRHPRLLTPPAGPGAAACALVDDRGGWLYAWVPDWVARPQAEVRPLPAGFTLRLAGLAPGAWQVEWWHVGEGRAVATVPLAVGLDGMAELTPPAAALGHQVAAKLRRTAAEPALELALPR